MGLGWGCYLVITPWLRHHGEASHGLKVLTWLGVGVGVGVGVGANPIPNPTPAMG